MSVRKPWLLPVLLLAMLALALPLAGMLLSRDSSAIAPVRWIEVSGPFERVTAEQVRTAVAPALRGGFFFLPLAEVRERVAAMNWVDSVEVRKRWPDTVEVRLSERELLARLGRDHLVDRQGRIFDADGHVPTGGLPRLDVSAQRLPQALALHQLAGPDLDRLGLSLARLELSDRGAAALETTSGLRIVLGRSDHQRRWQRLTEGLQLLRARDPRKPSRIDLRYTNGFAVAFAGDAAGANEAGAAAGRAQP